MTRLLVKPAEAAELLSISKRSVYDLIAQNADFRAAVIELPGIRGKFLRRDLLEAAVARLSPGAGEVK